MNVRAPMPMRHAEPEGLMPSDVVESQANEAPVITTKVTRGRGSVEVAVITAGGKCERLPMHQFRHVLTVDKKRLYNGNAELFRLSAAAGLQR